MKQVLQHLRTGEVELAELPTPAVKTGHVLIQTTHTLISAGTERMLVEFGKASLIAKARQQPDKVKQVLDKIRTDGLMPTLEAVFSRLDEPLPLGYCNVGRVLEVGRGVSEFVPGDIVASNGPHAEIVCVPKNLCAKVPEGVDPEHAAFTVLSSIGLQGVRLVEPTFGEQVVVVGLGLIGLVTVQLLRANGCRVLGVDVNPDRLKLAEQFGAETSPAGGDGDPVAAARAWTGGRGVDAVLITASAKTDEIMHQAAEMCRKRGRIVLVGVVGLNLRRADFYEKELTFQVSCSYGPGRYDDSYEQGGQDYPLSFVRWTEQRNFEAILGAMADRQLDVSSLITHRLAQGDAASAYQTITDDRSALGVIMQYPDTIERQDRISLSSGGRSAPATGGIGIIGAGNFTKMTIMPAFKKSGISVNAIANRTPAPAHHIAQKFGVPEILTDHQLLLQDDKISTVMISTGHASHAHLSIEALKAGKHVFVEKPLAMNVDQLREVIAAKEAYPDQQLLVGFNRRFSPHIVKLREALQGRAEPLAMTFTCNAGAIPPEHWTQDLEAGGGRIIGEACHFIDLMVCLAGSPVTHVSAAMMGQGVAVASDKMTITLSFEDGSVGNVNYFANGSKAYPKELLTVFSQGRVAHLDNFRKLTGFGFSSLKKFSSSRQDKGHAAEFTAFVDRVRKGGDPLIPFDELVNVTLASFAAMTAAGEHRTVDLDAEYAADLKADIQP